MFNDLQSEGLIGPFEIGQIDFVNRLIRQLDLANGQFKNIHLQSETCRRLLSSQLLKTKVEACFGLNLNLWRTNSFKKVDGSGEVAWHHARHFESGNLPIDFKSLDNHFSILVALTDMDDASGVMEFIPSSHLPQDNYHRDVRPFHQRELSEHFLDIPQTLLDKRVKVPLKQGQFMLFHSGLLHRSLPALGENINRYSLVARLCSDSTNIPEELASKQDIYAYPFVFDTKKRFVDHVALVTGGSRGIGKAIASQLLAEGARVVITGRHQQTLNDTTELLKRQTGNENLTYIVADAADFGQMQEVFKGLVNLHGTPDSVFVNAATNKPIGKVDMLSAEDWLSMVTSNIKSTYYTCKLAADNMKVYGGNIITLGSGIGHEGAANNSAYAVSKAANWSLTQSLAKELKEYSINVNELIPGPVKTDMNQGANGSVWKAPEDVVETALLLASQNLNFGSTGQSWAIRRV